MFRPEFHESARKALKKKGMPESLSRAQIAERIGQSDECGELIASCNSKMAIAVAFFTIGRSFVPKPKAPVKKKAAKKAAAKK